MDQMELRSGKALVRRGSKKDSENEFDEEVPDMLEGYAVRGTEREDIIAPKVSGAIEPTTHLPPLPTRDISSVRYQATLVMTSADQTSTRGLPRQDLGLHRSGRFNTLTSDSTLKLVTIPKI